jgi:hypothetical protein
MDRRGGDPARPRVEHSDIVLSSEAARREQQTNQQCASTFSQQIGMNRSEARVIPCAIRGSRC